MESDKLLVATEKLRSAMLTLVKNSHEKKIYVCGLMGFLPLAASSPNQYSSSTKWRRQQDQLQHWLISQPTGNFINWQLVLYGLLI